MRPGCHNKFMTQQNSPAPEDGLPATSLEQTRNWPMAGAGDFGYVRASPPDPAHPEGPRWVAKRLFKPDQAQERLLRQVGRFFKAHAHNPHLPRIARQEEGGYIIEHLEKAADVMHAHTPWAEDMLRAADAHNVYTRLTLRPAFEATTPRPDTTPADTCAAVAGAATRITSRMESDHHHPLSRLAAAMDLQKISADWPNIQKYPDIRAGLKQAGDMLKNATPAQFDDAELLSALGQLSAREGFRLDVATRNFGVRHTDGQMVWFDPVVVDKNSTPTPYLTENEACPAVAQTPAHEEPER